MSRTKMKGMTVLRLFIAAGIVCFTVGCGGLMDSIIRESRPTVIGNLLISRYHNLNVKVAPEYRHIGHTEYYEEAKSASNPLSTATRVWEVDAFVPQDASGLLNSAVLVMSTRLLNPGWFTYGSSYNESNKFVFNHGVSTIAGQAYESVTHSMLLGKGHHSLYDFFLKQGPLTTSMWFISRTYTHITGENSRVYVRYVEDIRSTGFTVSEWSDKNRLKPAQMEFLDAFEKRAAKAMEIVPGTTYSN